MIVLKDICKKFGSKKVLDNISFHIAPKETVGIIGLNGAGKTTLLNIMSGILKPDSGFIRINGAESLLEHYNALRKLTYVSGTKSQLWEDMKVKDSFDNCITMYHLDKQGAKSKLEQLIKLFEIESFLTSVPKSLSLGERMRCELVYALLTEPEILMLDEAMIGLDVSIKHKIMEYFEEYKKTRKTTMLVTSHNLLEVESLCDRIILLDRGEIVFDGSIDRIMKEYSPLYHMEVKIQGQLPDFEDLPLEKYYLKNDVLDIVFDKKKIETAAIIEHIMKKCSIEDVQLHEPDLEGTIKKLVTIQDQDNTILYCAELHSPYDTVVVTGKNPSP